MTERNGTSKTFCHADSSSQRAESGAVELRKKSDSRRPKHPPTRPCRSFVHPHRQLTGIFSVRPRARKFTGKKRLGRQTTKRTRRGRTRVELHVSQQKLKSCRTLTMRQPPIEDKRPLPGPAPQLQDHVDGASRRYVVVRQSVVVSQLLPAVDQSDLVHL